MSKFVFANRRAKIFTTIALLMTLSMLAWVGCAGDPQGPNAPEAAQEILLTMENVDVQAAMRIQNQHTDMLMAIDGVEGTATGMTADGQPAILVLTREAMRTRAFDKRSPIPADLDGIPIVELVTGEIRALKGKPPGGGGGFDPTNKHRPAPNGVSIGHPDITAGTLGCLVANGGTTYILSNNHVMADENRANNNDPIYQPGPFDGGGAGDAIATLSDFEPIVFSTSVNNFIDAAIAAVDPADVTGATVSYGAPNTMTTSASVNMRVTKYGRTTSSTNGRVQGINATINVGYDTGVARFVNQIVIGGGGFSSGGDSGSLIVVQKGGNANNPVGLLFAGGGGTTIANPIDAVLNHFNVTIVGN